jgi:hypothetical protein
MKYIRFLLSPILVIVIVSCSSSSEEVLSKQCKKFEKNYGEFVLKAASGDVDGARKQMSYVKDAQPALRQASDSRPTDETLYHGFRVFDAFTQSYNTWSRTNLAGYNHSKFIDADEFNDGVLKEMSIAANSFVYICSGVIPDYYTPVNGVEKLNKMGFNFEKVAETEYRDQNCVLKFLPSPEHVDLFASKEYKSRNNSFTRFWRTAQYEEMLAAIKSMPTEADFVTGGFPYVQDRNLIIYIDTDEYMFATLRSETCLKPWPKSVGDQSLL